MNESQLQVSSDSMGRSIGCIGGSLIVDVGGYVKLVSLIWFKLCNQLPLTLHPINTVTTIFNTATTIYNYAPATTQQSTSTSLLHSHSETTITVTTNNYTTNNYDTN